MEKTEAESANMPDEKHIPDEHYVAVGRPLVDLIGKSTNGLCPENTREAFSMYAELSEVSKTLAEAITADKSYRMSDVTSAEVAKILGIPVFKTWTEAFSYNVKNSNVESALMRKPTIKAGTPLAPSRA